MNSTEPLAASNFSFTVGAVQPTYLPTRSARPTSIKSPTDSSPFSFMIWAKSRATVVLAVPGLPVNTMCMAGRSKEMPFSRNSFWAL